MKTLKLEIDNSIYDKLLSLLEILPENKIKIFTEQNDDRLKILNKIKTYAIKVKKAKLPSRDKRNER